MDAQSGHRARPRQSRAGLLHQGYCCTGISEAGATPEWYEDVIESEILPLLREYWFDDEARVREWEKAARKMTMTAPRIPIQNLYYLLCYAWNRLPQRQARRRLGRTATELANLFAHVCAKASTT